MGDRGNIVIESDGDCFPSPVYLYTHWTGSDLPKIVKNALEKARDRWRDPAYLARVLFQTLIDGDEGITGYGLSTSMGDGGTEIYLNIANQKVRFRDKTQTFAEFIALDSPAIARD